MAYRIIGRGGPLNRLYIDFTMEFPFYQLKNNPLAGVDGYRIDWSDKFTGYRLNASMGVNFAALWAG